MTGSVTCGRRVRVTASSAIPTKTVVVRFLTPGSIEHPIKTCAVLGLSDQVHVGTASVFGIVFTLATIVFQVIVILFATRQLRKRKLDEQTEMGEK